MPASTRQAVRDESSSERITVKSGGREWTIEPSLQGAKARRDKLITLSGVTTTKEPVTNDGQNHSTDSWLHHLAARFITWLDHVFFSGTPLAFSSTLRTSAGSTDKSRSYAFPKVRDALQWGSVLGLLLGCICVIGLRTIQPVAAVEPLPKLATAVPSAPVLPRSIVLGPTITIPAMRMYGLYVAQQPTNSTMKPTWQLQRVAAYSADLLSYKSLARSMKNPIFKIKPIDWNVHPLQTLPTTSKSASIRVSTWLSSETSALCALIGSLADGEPAKDAWTAYRTSRQLTPKAEYVGATGQAHGIQTYAAEVQSAFVAIAHGHTAEAWTSIKQSLQTLQSMQ